MILWSYYSKFPRETTWEVILWWWSLVSCWCGNHWGTNGKCWLLLLRVNYWEVTDYHSWLGSYYWWRLWGHYWGKHWEVTDATIESYWDSWEGSWWTNCLSYARLELCERSWLDNWDLWERFLGLLTQGRDLGTIRAHRRDPDETTWDSCWWDSWIERLTRVSDNWWTDCLSYRRAWWDYSDMHE